jgi:hypothetical protein
VDSGIGPPGHGQLGFRSQDPAERFGQDPFDGSNAALTRPAVKAGSVVGQIEPDDPDGATPPRASAR